MRVAIYARISRDEEDQRVGVDRQIVRGSEVAERNGWIVAATFVDNDMSAFRGQRPGFEALRAAIKAGEVEAVIVQHLDRLARNVTTFRQFAELCERHDVRIETWSGPVDTTSAAGRFMATIQSATDEHYSALISEKARAAHRDIAERGEPNGGRRPFGYVRSVNDEGRRTFEPHPEEAPILAEMFDRVAAGASIHGLCVELNDRGITTAGGAWWKTARLREMLQNPTYIGVRVHRGEWLEGNWPALVNRDTFEAVQGILRSRIRGPDHNLRKYWLSGGLSVCGVCGHRLVSKPLRGKPSYVCPAVTDGGCGRIRTAGEGFEKHMSDIIVQALTDPRIGEALQRRQGGDNAEVIARLDDLERRRTELAEAFALGEIDRAQLRAGTKRLDEERDRLRSQLAPAGGPALTLEDLRELWESGDAAWRHRVAATLFEKIVVNPAVRGRNFYDPGRVEIVWNT